MTHVLIDADVLREVREYLLQEANDGDGYARKLRYWLPDPDVALSRLPDEGQEPFTRCEDGSLSVPIVRDRGYYVSTSYKIIERSARRDEQGIRIIDRNSTMDFTGNPMTDDEARAVALAILALTTGPRDGGTDGN